MALIAPPSTNKDFTRENPPTGMQLARVFRIAELGTHPKTFQGETKMQRQIRIDWELPTKLLTQGELAGKPFCVGETFGFSVTPKSTLRKKVLNGLVPGMTDEVANAFDLTKLLGQECLINIARSENMKDPNKPYFNIMAVTPLMEGMSVPPNAPANPKVAYALGDTEAWDLLPKWIKDKIGEAEEYKHLAPTGTEGAGKPADDESIPF